MPHVGYFWNYDKEAVAAVNAAGLNIVSGKNINTLNGQIKGRYTHVMAAPIQADQEGEGALFTGRLNTAKKFEIDKDGNISAVGTVDGVDISGFKIVSIGPAAFLPRQETYQWTVGSQYLRNRITLESQFFYAPVFFPNGVTITKVRLAGRRAGVGDYIRLQLARTTEVGGVDTMVDLTADWTDGYGNMETETIDYALIDNSTYFYWLYVQIDPDTNVQEAEFNRAEITWS